MAIAAMYVIQDLLSDSTKPLSKLVVATLAQKWMMDRLINNTVNVTIGPQVEQFVLLADGSYNPQLGSSDRLNLAGGQYTLRTKEGVTLSFDATGNVSSWLNPAGVNVSFTYDASSPPLLTSVSNSAGRTLTLGYNGSKQLTSVTDNSSPARSVIYGYDSAGNPTSMIDPLGAVSTFSYGVPAGTQLPPLLTKIFYPSNPTTAFVTNTYDTLGRVAAQANATGVAWNYFFAGYRSEEDDPYATQHVLYYNPRGKVLFDIQDYAGLGLVTAILYDGLDRLSSVTQPEGGKTTYTYDTANAWANNVASVVRVPKPGSGLTNLTTGYTYEPIFNKPTSVTDPLGLVTAMTYQPATGNLLLVVADKGASPHFNARTSFTYNSLGLPTSMTDPTGMLTQNTYDSFGNLISRVRDPGTGHINETTAYGYNTRGDPTSVTDPRLNVTTNTYDAARRLLTSTAPPPLGGVTPVVTSLVYDADGHVLQARQSAAGSMLRVVGGTYTPTGKPATTTDANGNVTRYAYDLLDRLAKTTDAVGRVTTYAYDALSRPTNVYNLAIQANPLLQQTYTADGLRASLTDANANTSTFAYDGFDRLATTTYPNAGGATTETFTYDGNGNVLTRKNRAGTTITYTYDTLNRLATKAVPSAATVTYGYDLAGRPTSVSDTGAAIAAIASAGTPSYTTSYTYDALNRPLGVSWTPAPAAATPPAGSVTFTHSYNGVNQRIGQSVTDNSWINYPPGPTATTSYTANALNQYTSVGAVTPAYDGNGNLTSDGTFTFGYDGENRLVSASKTGTTASYDYDGRGQRKQKTVNGAKTVSVTDADNREVLEYDGSTGAILRWYAYGLGPNDVLGQMNVPANTRVGLLPDLQGSVIGQQDAGTGATTSFAYRPYGASNPTPGQFGYAGQRVDAETALYYYRARMYSTAWGRFMQGDPVGYSAGMNLYSYVENDPLNFVDPSGLASASVVTYGPGLQVTVTARLTENPLWLGGPQIANSILNTTSGFIGGSNLHFGTDTTTANGNLTPVGPPVSGRGIGFSNIFGETFVPDNLLPPNARDILRGRELQPNGSVFLPIPPGYILQPAENGEGIVFRAPGTTGNSNIIRLANPNDFVPYAYLRVYNSMRQPISIFTGRPVPNASGHYPFAGFMLSP